MAVVKVIRTKGLPILQQLKLEEALLRASTGNWCFINDGCRDTAIVLGISGKVEELVHEEAARKAGVQLIRRFTGGGTVIVDQNTVFAGLIMHGPDLPGEIECYPRPIMDWTREFYNGVFGAYGEFSLKSQDYTLGEKKFAGNAQAITKQRFCHHTSFLWDFADSNMRLLKHPAKAPGYRQGRSHLDFLCKLKDVAPSRNAITNGIHQELQRQGFKTEDTDIEEAEALLEERYLRSNKLLSS